MFKIVSEEVAKNMLEGKVRIGSSDYYRSIEDGHRVDAQEGGRSIKVTNSEDDMRLSVDQFNKLLEQTGARFRSNKLGLKIRGKKGESMTMHSEINMLMFCVSQRPNLSKFGSKSLKIVDPEKFGLAVCNSLVNSIANGELNVNGLPVRIEFRFAPMQYGSKDSKPFFLDQDLPHIALNDFFVKPAEYKDEEEVRFVWYLLDEQGRAYALPLGFKYLDVQLNDLDLFELVA